MGDRTPTGRRAVILAALLAGGLLGGPDRAPAAAAGGPSVQVERLSVRLPRRLPASPGQPVLGCIALEAWLFSDRPFWEFDPSTDPLRVSVGGVVLLEGPPFAGPKRSERRPLAEFRLAQRGGFSPRSLVLVRLDPLTGRLRLRARAVDVSPFLAGGSGPVEVRVEFGEGTARDPVTMHAVGAMRLVFPPPPGSPTLAVPIPAPLPPPSVPPPGPLSWSEIVENYYRINPGGAGALVFRDSGSWSTYW
ncbi:MAG TPA: hypothetical protein VFS92_06855, partial [Planctomycetota bacterium]|nr:hypothetical protein [Planctomycetota bacterium]